MKNVLIAIIPLTGAVIFGGISGYLFYLLLKNEDEDIAGTDTEVGILKALVTEKVAIPKEAIGMIIGRQGSNVQIIQRETCTNINFSKADGAERFCIIRGQEKNVEKAKNIILNCIKDVPNFIEIKFQIPKTSCGKVIGKGGSNITNIANRTGTKIFIDRHEDNFDEAENTNRIVTIKGSKEEVDAAKRLVLEKVKEEGDFKTYSNRISLMNTSPEEINKKDENVIDKGQKTTKKTLAGRKSDNRDHSPIPLLDASPISLMEACLNRQVSAHTAANREVDVSSKRSIFPNSPDFTNIYISAVASPMSFWVQIVDDKLALLKKLTSDMTKYYKKENNRQPLSSEQRFFGKMVASVYPNDDMIYRGRLAERQPNDDPNLEVVYYVDYGDVDFVHPSVVFDLKPPFLKLNFQAIECCLYGVENIVNSEKEATALFEKLCPLMSVIKAKLVGYKKIRGLMVPTLQLVIKVGNKEINIAKELVNKKSMKEDIKICVGDDIQLPDDVVLE